MKLLRGCSANLWRGIIKFTCHLRTPSHHCNAFDVFPSTGEELELITAASVDVFVDSSEGYLLLFEDLCIEL